MKHLAMFAFVLVVMAGSASAQEPQKNGSTARYRWNSYLGWGASFFPDGSGRTAGNFGFGGEFLFMRGLGAGAEIAVVGSENEAAGMASLNGVYHFVRSPFRCKGFVPFVTGGVTSASAGDGANAAGGNVGGGITWWFRERAGVRMEVRDYIFGSGSNFLSLRLGIAFR
jgi:hypothetical protein